MAERRDNNEQECIYEWMGIGLSARGELSRP